MWSQKDIQRDPLGAIRRDGCLSGMADEFTYGWDHSIGLALKTDAVNALIFSIWWSGFLNGPLDLRGE